MSQEELITQDEMESLLQGVSEGDVAFDPPPEGPSGEIVPYDFAYPPYKLKAHLPLLEVINERFTRALAAELSRQYHQDVQVGQLGFEASKFHDYSHGLPDLMSLNRIEVRPLPGTGLMCLDAPLVFFLVDSFFGGTGQTPALDDKREFTPTEQRLIERTLDSAFRAMRQAWETVHPIEPRFLRPEINRQITSPANPAEVLLVARFKVELRLGGGEFHVVLPYSMLEPIRHELTAALDKPRDGDQAWEAAFREAAFEAPLELRGVLGETEISLAELLRLQPGDFIPLGQGQKARFFADDIPVFEAFIGAANGMISAKLV